MVNACLTDHQKSSSDTTESIALSLQFSTCAKKFCKWAFSKIGEKAAKPSPLVACFKKSLRFCMVPVVVYDAQT
jgi:hypothetical protein